MNHMKKVNHHRSVVFKFLAFEILATTKEVVLFTVLHKSSMFGLHKKKDEWNVDSIIFHDPELVSHFSFSVFFSQF